ncbi:hypothetical protein AB1N83_004717 [Pleurotus pulmonarius]
MYPTSTALSSPWIHVLANALPRRFAVSAASLSFIRCAERLPHPNAANCPGSAPSWPLTLSSRCLQVSPFTMKSKTM